MAPAVTPWDSSTPTDPRFGFSNWLLVILNSQRNPGLRLFHFEQDTGRWRLKPKKFPMWISCRILNFEQFFLNLTAANEEGRADWQLEYDFLGYYGLYIVHCWLLNFNYRLLTLATMTSLAMRVWSLKVATPTGVEKPDHYRVGEYGVEQCCWTGCFHGARRIVPAEIPTGSLCQMANCQNSQNQRSTAFQLFSDFTSLPFDRTSFGNAN